VCKKHTHENVKKIKKMDKKYKKNVYEVAIVKDPYLYIAFQRKVTLQCQKERGVAAWCRPSYTDCNTGRKSTEEGGKFDMRSSSSSNKILADSNSVFKKVIRIGDHPPTMLVFLKESIVARH
jgi:hypothetical protein